MLADLNYATRGHIIQEPLKMEDKNGWKLLDEHLLARLAEARRSELDRLQVRDACECVFYSVHRIVLESFDVSHQDICVGGMGGGKTDLDVQSDRQSSMVAVSGRFDARTVERSFPPNMRLRGDSTDSETRPTHHLSAAQREMK